MDRPPLPLLACLARLGDMVVGVVAIDVPDERFEWFVLFRTPGDIGCCCCWFSGGDVAPAVVPDELEEDDEEKVNADLKKSLTWPTMP